jgi:hypothetical protein
MHLRTYLVVAFVALIATLCLVTWAVFAPVSWYDEGLSVYGAARVLDGDVPYRDFWTLYPPGQFYVMAAVFKVFGTSLLVARLYSVVVAVGTALCTLRLAAKLVPLFAAVGISLVVTALHLSLSWSFPVVPAVLFTLLSCNFLAEHRDSGDHRRLVAAGLAASAVALFRHDMGLPLLLAEGLYLLFTESAAAARRFVLAAALLLLPVAASILAVVPLRTLHVDFVEFPSIYAKVRGLPFPDVFPPRQPGQDTYYRLLVLQNCAFYFAPLVLTIAGAVLVRRWYQARHFARIGSLPLLLWLVGVLYLNNVRIRPDQAHVFAATVMALLVYGPLVVAPLLSTLRSAALLRARPVGYGVAIGLAGVLLLSPAALAIFVATDQDVPGTSFKPTPIARAGAVRFNNAARGTGVEEAVRFVQERVAIGEKIFVGRFRHDRLISNDIMFYFLVGRHASTPFFTMSPGLTDTQPVQNAIVRALEDGPTRYVVLTDIDGALAEPNDSGKSSGVTVLDGYIRSHYIRQATFGRYRIFRRK